MSKSKTNNPYVLLILLLLGSFVFFSLWSARQAATRGSRISDPAYYSKGLKYNHTQVEKRAAASRGWQLKTEVVKNQLCFRLFNKQHQSISRASGELTLFLGEKDQVLRLPTTETEPGTYLVKLPAGISGSVQARIEFNQQGVTLSRQLLVNP